MFNSGTTEGEEGFQGRGSRRRKIAGYLKAANELRQTYQNTYMHRDDVDEEQANVPGAFPTLKVTRNGNEEMVLFPSYARRHVRQTEKRPQPHVAGGDDLQREGNDAEFWKREWEIHEDANGVVDVDVRGWIYAPPRGPMNRKNRLLMSVARRLSGVPSPNDGSEPSSRSSSVVRGQERRQDEELAARQAQAIAARGEREADVAGRGGFSEREPRTGDVTGSGSEKAPKPGDIIQPLTDTSIASSEPTSLSVRHSWTQPSEMSPEELAVANRHLITRLQPFMNTPTAGMAITIFFFNEETSRSRSTRTNDSGHFNYRAVLDFIPTGLRVLASEDLSTSEEVVITEAKGISVISDIDDTVKHSAIGGGAREIFRNAFIRNLEDLSIDGVKEWYWSMSKMGAQIHYVSNSPWQMYPVLNSYFSIAGLPHGSYHLKQYSGMLQGIFEPVAERKRETIDRLFTDFPERQFLLIGDSGEADLEVYTETALMYPWRVLGIFIRDVTTEAKPAQSKPSEGRGNAPPLPPRRRQPPPEEDDMPDLGDLIDFSELSEDQQKSSSDTEPSSGLGLPASLKARPPRPTKPLALRSKSNEKISDPGDAGSKAAEKAPPPPLPPPRRQGTNASKAAPEMSRGDAAATAAPPPALPARPDARAHASAALQYAARKAWTGHEAGEGETAQERRVDLWTKRWARAQAVLKSKGVVLRTWRTGSDVQAEAERMIRAAAKSMG